MNVIKKDLFETELMKAVNNCRSAMDQDSETACQTNLKLKKVKVTYMDIICSILPILTYIADVVFDIIVANNHFNNGHEKFGILTVCFIVLPAVIMSGFSGWWYMTDQYKASTKQWIIRMIFLCLFMAPILRNFEALYYAWKSLKCSNPSKKDVYSQRMVYENTDAAYLRLCEAFMESAPQLLLQIYILAEIQATTPNYYTATERIQLVSIFTSLISMSWALASYQRSLRNSLNEKNDLSCTISLFPIVGRFFEISSRVIALGLFASVFPYYFCIFCAVHFVAMFIWMRILNTTFCDNKFGEFIYNIILGVMFIFCYFNPKDSPTLRRSAIFYILVFLENSTLMIVWFQYYPPDVISKLSIAIVQFTCFIMGIMIMLLYYIVFHPTIGLISKNSKKVPKVQMQTDGANVMLNGQMSEPCA